MKRFGLAEAALPYFRTIHSLVFRQLGIRRDSVMQWSHYRDLGQRLGMDFQGRTQTDGSDLYGMSKDDRLMFIESLSRAKQEPLRQTWEASNEPDVDWFELERYSRALKLFKSNNMLLDFSDMLDEFVRRAPGSVPALDVLIVDEVQDLAKSQWAVFHRLADKAGRVYVAGDDDQAVYKWSGADVDSFLELPGEVEILDQSYRVPRNIHKTASAVSGRISKRQAKTWKPKEGDPGAEHWYNDAEEVDLSSGTWLLLARNGYMLAPLEEMCLHQGYSFTSVGKSPLDAPSLQAIILWERLRKGHTLAKDDLGLMLRFISAAGFPASGRTQVKLSSIPLGMKQLQGLGLRYQGETVPIWHEALDKVPAEERQYYISARRRGETLTKTPRINISTIHAAKGGEADHVLVLTDVSTKSAETMNTDPDSEHRTFYVALTRAKQGLHLIEPKTGSFYQI